MRKLTLGEIGFLRPIYGDAVDYAAVRVSPTRLVSRRAFVLGARIRIARDIWAEDFSAVPSPRRKALLVHEVGHVWQFQRLPGYHWSKALLEHLRFGRGKVYLYELTPGKPLTDYRWEQQGTILADYFLARLAATPDLPRLEAAVRASIPGDGGEEPIK